MPLLPRACLLAPALLAAACAAVRPPAPSAPPEVAAAVLAAVDRKADPCQDFYRYACGSWLDVTKLPADQSSWTRSFSVITEDNRAFVRRVLEEAGGSAGSDPDRRRLGDTYAACMDEAAVEKAGAAPLAPWLARIAAVKDLPSLLDLVGELHAGPSSPLFGVGPINDFHDPGLQILLVLQPDLGLPEKDFYLGEEPRQKELRAAYQRHLAAMLGLLGEPAAEAARHAAEVLAFETRLARASRDRTALQEYDKLYNRVDRAGLEKLAPAIPWDRYFRALGHPGITAISAGTPEYFPGLEAALRETPVPTLQAYLRWSLVHDTASSLSRAFVEEHFAFYGKVLSGQAELEPRWKRCVAATERALGELVGKVYVAERFPGDSKQVALEMIGDIEEAFGRALPGLAWMDDATRQKALEKKAAVANKIGYPDRWRDYSSLPVRSDDHFGNALAAAGFETRRQLDKVGKPTDRSEWIMGPQEVNAYYNPFQNEIAFPAGILQPPFFRRDYPAAMNYGAIGMVIGHELSHGFDSVGRKFDAQGRLREWWAPEVATRFEKQTQCVEQQYSRFQVEPGLPANGKLTLGENIADIAGLKQAWLAYQAWQRRHPGPAPTVPGLTADQLFFVAQAQSWCSISTPEKERLRTATGEHSLPRFRVNGPVANHPAFAATFQCPAGAPMNPAEKCVVW